MGNHLPRFDIESDASEADRSSLLLLQEAIQDDPGRLLRIFDELPAGSKDGDTHGSLLEFATTKSAAMVHGYDVTTEDFVSSHPKMQELATKRHHVHSPEATAALNEQVRRLRLRLFIMRTLEERGRILNEEAAGVLPSVSVIDAESDFLPPGPASDPTTNVHQQSA